MNKTGYKTHFIEQLPVPFPQLSPDQVEDLVVIDTKRTGEIPYLHFSLFLSRSRKFPFFTATNINGQTFQRIPRKQIFDSGRDEWSIDDRISDHQWGQNLYNAKKSDFQRGHMTKREDPQWGNSFEEAREAAQQTFFFSNCVPQLGDLNTKAWGRLETYILSTESVPNALKISVFTGPVLSPNDPVFVTEVQEEEVALPTLFWKVVYFTPDGETLHRVGFLMGQENLLLERGIAIRRKPSVTTADWTAAFFDDFEDRAIYQVTIETLEKLTRLRFADAEEPYRDRRPLRLILEEVEVPAAALAEPHIAMDLDEETGRRLRFPNMVLQPAVPSFALQSAGTTRSTVSAGMRAGLAGGSGPREQYTRDLKRNFGYYATWNPGLQLHLGDIGLLKGKTFRKIGELKQLGVSFTPAPDPTPTDLKYASKGGVFISTKLAGAAQLPGSSLGEGDAGIVVDFTKEDAILFQANGTLTNIISDTISLGEAVLELYKSGKWNKEWVVITELISATSATILISKTAGAKIELKANATLAAPRLDIANAGLQFSVQTSRALEIEIIAKDGLTPLFNVMGIETHLFAPPDFLAMGLSPLDLLTPEKAKGEWADRLRFTAR